MTTGKEEREDEKQIENPTMPVEVECNRRGRTIARLRTERNDALRQLEIIKLRALSTESMVGIAPVDEVNKALGKPCTICDGTGEIDCGCPEDLYDETTGLCNRCVNTGKIKCLMCLMCEVNAEEGRKAKEQRGIHPTIEAMWKGLETRKKRTEE